MRAPRSDFKQLPIGARFGFLTIVKESQKPSGSRAYLCRCDCGGSILVSSHYLRRGRTISCKCARTKRASLLNRSHGQARVRKITSEYRSWVAMRNRCRDTNDINYPRYGGRGISVCSGWLDSFENFFQDMGPKPNRTYSIERVDNNGDYSPENCIWATKKAQARNRRSTRLISYNGAEVSLAEAAELSGIPYSTVRAMAIRGEPIKAWP